MITLFLWLTSLISLAGAASNAMVQVDGLVMIRATVSDDLRSIHGEITLPPDPNARWRDLLKRLPIPKDDRTAQRTWVHWRETGWISLGPKTEGPRRFHTILPRRTGASGFVPRRGIFANGLWHPHPVVDGRAATVSWDVEIQIPAGATGVLNGGVGYDLLRWSGTADRLSLAVIPQGRIQRIPLTTTQDLILVDRGPRRAQRDQRIRSIAEGGSGLPGSSSIVIVETPDRRRLTRTGPGTVFLSDRATRLTGSAWKFHARSIRRSMYSASIQNPDPWARDIAGSVLAEASPQPPDARDTLKWLSWLPPIDNLLYSGTLPFMSDLFDETWPSDPIFDDALERVERVVPGHVAARKLTDLFGTEALGAMSVAILGGADVDTAASLAGVPAQALSQWRLQPPEQDLRVEVSPSEQGWRIDLHRDTQPSAPQEAIPLSIDGQRRSWRAGPGADHKLMTTMTRPNRVQLDPDITVKQTDRSNDEWPTRWTLTASAQIPEVVLRTGRPTASGNLALRKRYSTRWVYGASASTNPVDLAAMAGSISYGHGARTDRRTHTWRSWIQPRLSLLDPQFGDIQTRQTALELTMGIRKDTRTAWPIAQRGHRLALGLSQGRVLKTGKPWSRISVSGLGLFSPAPHLVVASRVRAGSTNASLAHRQLALGGSNGVQGLYLDQRLGQSVIIGSTELRWTPMHYASIPLGLLWVSHMQLSAGVDAGMLWREDQRDRAAGWTGGLAFVGDLFGGRPALLGLWVAGTLPDPEDRFVQADELQLYLRGTQAF